MQEAVLVFYRQKEDLKGIIKQKATYVNKSTALESPFLSYIIILNISQILLTRIESCLENSLSLKIIEHDLLLPQLNAKIYRSSILSYFLKVYDSSGYITNKQRNGRGTG